VASIFTAFCVVSDVRRISEGALFIIVTESILCEVPAETEESVEHEIHNVHSTTCFQHSDFDVEFRG
jgi:hypothetical protein